MELSVIIPTYNPNTTRLNQTLNGLKAQTLATNLWEVIIVDNNSSIKIEADTSWHPNTTIVHEARQGLTHARLKGFATAKAGIIIMVDDDNILDANYLSNALEIFKNHPQLGAAGGKSIPLFEEKPPVWITEFYHNLALRNLGDAIILKDWQNEYPDSAPIGAGMVTRKQALESYIKRAQSGENLTGDRTGNSLSSGGDNEMVIEVLKSGWQTGYFPQLTLQHIIPQKRTGVKYLAQLLNQTNKSWVQLLSQYHINPWNRMSSLGALSRKVKSYFTQRAWKNEQNFIKWKGLCGMYDGLVK